MTEGKPMGSSGTAVPCNPGAGVDAQIVDISLPANVMGVEYNFGEIWFGKGNYLTDPQAPTPPGAVPPPPEGAVPEPGTLALLAVAAVALGGAAWYRRRSPLRPARMPHGDQ